MAIKKFLKCLWVGHELDKWFPPHGTIGVLFCKNCEKVIAIIYKK